MGQRGSPINLENPVLTSYPPFKFDHYDTAIPSMTLTNTGHTLLLSLPKKHSTDQIPAISGGGLNGTFNFVQLHFHWGSDLKKGGSEHLINSKRYAAEMHLVHYKFTIQSTVKSLKLQVIQTVWQYLASCSMLLIQLLTIQDMRKSIKKYQF